jgi:hypothetical protein
MQYPIPEREVPILGVPGRMYMVHEPQNVRGRMVHRNQTWKSQGRPIEGYGPGGRIVVEVKFDDQCANGHQTFHITADVTTTSSRARRDIAAGGCMHEAIEQVFPELAPLIKWHHCTTDGPLHYIANTTYHASNRDHYGRAAGEANSWKHAVLFGSSPVSHDLDEKLIEWCMGKSDLKVIEVPHIDTGGKGYKFKPKYTFEGYRERLEWHTCPFDTLNRAEEFAQGFMHHSPKHMITVTGYSEGKPRELAFARSCAIWPDATDEQLCLPKDELTALLEARLPALLAEFRTVMETCGFLWEPEQK